jgi:hypothetical protein
MSTIDDRLEQEKIESDVKAETVEKYEKSTMSKAGKLAMELAEEKRRLVKELEELQVEYEGVKPTTPTGTLDWYVKWIAIVFAVLGIFLISSGFTVLGQVAYIISGFGWIFVGMQWSDRAIMIGSSITTTAVAMNLMEIITLAY